MPDNENLEVVGDEPQYEYITSPIITDDTGQDIKTAINALANAISPAAVNVTFDNTGTDLTSSNAESAIKEVNSKKSRITFTTEQPAGSSTNTNGWLQLTASGAGNVVPVGISGTTTYSFGQFQLFGGIWWCPVYTVGTSNLVKNTAVSGFTVVIMHYNSAT